ncbi:MAG: response regulator, partial [SAR86 cluster bacterium]
MTALHQVLIVEDEIVIRTSLRRLLEKHNYDVSEAGSVKEAMESFNPDDFDIVISDLRLPGAPGTDLIKATNTPVLIMTSYSSIRSAISAMKIGAVDYIAKPFEHQEMIESVAKIVRNTNGTYVSQDLPDEDAKTELPIQGMIGSCPQMLELFRRIRKVALTDSTVLINGESGTGKELVAKGIHRLSTRT